MTVIVRVEGPLGSTVRVSAAVLESPIGQRWERNEGVVRTGERHAEFRIGRYMGDTVGLLFLTVNSDGREARVVRAVRVAPLLSVSVEPFLQLRGRVIDEVGGAVRGATVRVVGYRAVAAEAGWPEGVWVAFRAGLRGGRREREAVAGELHASPELTMSGSAVTTNELGEFSIERLWAGEFLVELTWLSGDETYVAREIVRLPSADVVLTAGRLVPFGVEVRDASGRALAGAQITVVRKATAPGHGRQAGLRFGSTGSDGRASFEDVRADEIDRLHVHPPRSRPSLGKRSLYGPFVTPTHVTLEASRLVSGSAVLPGGAGASRARVYFVWETPSRPQTALVACNVQGAFRVEPPHARARATYAMAWPADPPVDDVHFSPAYEPATARLFGVRYAGLLRPDTRIPALSLAPVRITAAFDALPLRLLRMDVYHEPSGTRIGAASATAIQLKAGLTLLLPEAAGAVSVLIRGFPEGRIAIGSGSTRGARTVSLEMRMGEQLRGTVRGVRADHRTILLSASGYGLPTMDVPVGALGQFQLAGLAPRRVTLRAFWTIDGSVKERTIVVDPVGGRFPYVEIDPP